MYGPTVLAQAGWDTHKIGWISALLNTTGILGTFICAMLIDRIGRRGMLYIGSAGCAIAMFVAGGFAKLVHDHPENNTGYGIGTTVFLFVFTVSDAGFLTTAATNNRQIFYSSTWLMVTWICMSVSVLGEAITDHTQIQPRSSLPKFVQKATRSLYQVSQLVALGRRWLTRSCFNG
jgi:MFS family permease